MKKPVLVLNKIYMPIGVDSYKNVFCNIFSEAVFPLDIHYEKQSDGRVDIKTIEYWNVIKSVQEWQKLPIRNYDEFVHTVSGPIRVPTVVLCSNFSGIIHRQAKFPTKRNIFERDKYTCVYTGKKLSKEELSVDHIIPVSKGGKSTWENLVTCDRDINSKKSNKFLHETNLKLKYKPFKPKDGFKFEIYREEWSTFLDNL